MKQTDLKKRRLLSIVFLAVFVPSVFVGAKIMTDPIKPWMGREEVPKSYDKATLTVRGIVTKVERDHISFGLISYHIFPAFIVLNITEVVWMDDKVVSGIYPWDNRSVIGIGYDISDVPDLAVGDFVEASGFWDPTTDSAYSMKLTIAASINGGYVKRLP